MGKADPPPGSVASRQTNEFRSEPAHDDAEAALFLGQDVEQTAVACFFAVGKVHAPASSGSACSR
jgi:hypothetical protein